MCVAYVNVENWERATELAERICERVKARKLCTATPFSGTMVLLAVMSIFSIINDSKAHDTLRSNRLVESLDCLVNFAHHIAERYPVLVGFAQLVKLKHDVLLERKTMSTSILATQLPSPPHTEPKLLSYLTALTKVELLQLSCQGHNVAGREEIHAMHATKIYIRSLYILYK
jgi:hypothetical protein